MQQLLQREVAGGTATIWHSTRADGDLSPSTVAADALSSRRSAAVGHPWHVVRQVHSDRVVVVDHATARRAQPSRLVADALVTAQPDQVLAVHAGDCAPVGFIHPAGAVAAAHAGWVGLEAGVIESTVRQLRSSNRDAPVGPVVAAIGPHIRAARYEFGNEHLERLARRFGEHVIAETDDGTPAFDLTAALVAELERLDIDVAVVSPACTAAAAGEYWSHRARQESGRIALVAWLEKR